LNTRICILTLLSLTFLFGSCNNAKKKAEDSAEKIKKKIIEKKDKLIDEVMPIFNSDVPDTKSNKKRFKEFLKTEATADVKNLYCYDDAIGIDADYQFAFTCNDSTIQKIITNLGLTKTVKENIIGLSFASDFPWWDTAHINRLEPYWKKGEHETYWYLWFDEKTKKAYFFTFDM